MFQKMRKAALLLACTLTASFFGGCGNSFDAAAYTKALLDNSYKNDSTEFVDMKIGTKEEAAKLYEKGIEDELAAVTSQVEMSDDMQEEYRTLFGDIFSKVKYTVEGSEKQDDGSYVVTVAYERMNVFGPALESYMTGVSKLSEKWTEAAAAGEETPDENAMYEEIFGMLRDSLKDSLANVSYSDKETLTVNVVQEDKTYTIKEEDVEKIEKALFDVDAFEKLSQQ